MLCPSEQRSQSNPKIGAGAKDRGSRPVRKTWHSLDLMGREGVSALSHLLFVAMYPHPHLEGTGIKEFYLWTR